MLREIRELYDKELEDFKNEYTIYELCFYCKYANVCDRPDARGCLFYEREDEWDTYEEQER